MRHAICAIPAILLLGQATLGAAEIDRVARGTEIAVRTNEPIRLDRLDRGRIYPAEVARNVYATDGDLAFPRGARRAAHPSLRHPAIHLAGREWRGCG